MTYILAQTRGRETGLFITEALHPLNVFRAANFEVDLVFDTGSYQPNWLSQQPDWLKDEDKRIWEHHNSEFRSKLDNILKPGDVNWQNNGIFIASAGHASLIDYPEAKGLQNIAANMYISGNGIVLAVCYGGAIFPGIVDSRTGKSIISGKKVTAFTTQGEEEGGII
ncbi:MAG: hypothetical protein Q9217_000302 [Psora testacea]